MKGCRLRFTPLHSSCTDALSTQHSVMHISRLAVIAERAMMVLFTSSVAHGERKPCPSSTLCNL